MLSSVRLRQCLAFRSPWILCAQLFLGGEQLDAVLQLKKSLLLRFVVHALVLVKVLRSVQIQKTVRKHPEQHKKRPDIRGGFIL